MANNNYQESAGRSQRQLRVGELIRRTLSEVLMRGDLHDSDLAHVSITVGEVRVTKDLREAVVFVLPLGGVNTDVVVDALTRNKGELRRVITKTMKLRYSPDLKFLADKSFDQMDETNRLLDLDNVRRDLDKG